MLLISSSSSGRRRRRSGDDDDQATTTTRRRPPSDDDSDERLCSVWFVPPSFVSLSFSQDKYRETNGWVHTELRMGRRQQRTWTLVDTNDGATTSISKGMTWTCCYATMICWWCVIMEKRAIVQTYTTVVVLNIYTLRIHYIIAWTTGTTAFFLTVTVVDQLKSCIAIQLSHHITEVSTQDKVKSMPIVSTLGHDGLVAR